ncbi:MAG: oligopeptidase A [Chromatiales bacterium]|jgi:oligopeptidase A|nr:oligopeptidase A [Chromatiales bacterium]MDP6150313.1 M3 family metallopeptidase [Gammaproteobacteria bacterium]MDP7270932.1 M3 family metallopeptidase [Gammaproteobacteria bacterium]HJP05103.1 M3 family metallopeptidase [Gammaproteobacteria bacterium]
MTNPLLAEGGLPSFSQIQPDHVEPALDETLRRNREELEQLLASEVEPDFVTAIAPLEEMQDRLHRTWAPVSHLQMVKTSDELREVYNRCLPKLARYATEMAQDKRLFRLYKTVNDKLDGANNTPEGKLLEHALRDFRLAGVDLPDEQKKQFGKIMEALSQVQAKFEQNLLDSMAAWSRHETDEKKLCGIPAAVLDAAQTAAADQDMEGWLLLLDQPTYIGVITHADDASLRKDFYTAWVTRASDQRSGSNEFDNTGLMEEIMGLRHKAAKLVGFDNYANYALASRMAGSVAEVTKFLGQLAKIAKPVAINEFNELQAWTGRELQAWDVAYYSEKLRLKNFSISDEELRPYFSLERIMDGLFQVMQQLYGLTAREEQDVDRWQPEVRYYSLINDQNEPVGSFFIDLYARRNKRSGAWMDECVLRKRSNSGVQLPVAHLVCNFTCPAEDKPALLTHEEIVTLFHEFGHTLHHLLTRVDYPSVSGINGVPWDAVELPSQFMENFAWDPDVVRNMSSHFETGEPLPDDLLLKLQASRVFHSGIQMVRQIEFSLFDWRIHSEYDPERGAHIRETLAEVRKSWSVIETPEFSRFENSFAHVFGGGYAAGYYSYKWAEVLAADAFAAFREVGLFDRGVANRFRETILEVGGTADIGTAFQAFRGRAPQIEPLLEQAGIVNSKSARP